MKKGIKIAILIIILVLIAVFAVWLYYSPWRAQASAKYLEEGDRFLENGDSANAIIAYKKSGVLTPRSPAPYYKQGILAKTNGHYTEAIDFFQKAVGFGETVIWPQMTLGETYLLAGNVEQAQTSYLAARRIDPNNDIIPFQLFKIALINDDLDEAQKHLDKATEINPLPKYTIYSALILSFTDPVAAQDKISKLDGETRLKEMQVADFVSVFMKLARTESSVSREIIIAQTFNQLGENEFAIARLEKITQENPDIRDAWAFLGYGYLIKNENEKTLNAINKAIELDTEFAFSHYLLGKYYDLQGQFAKAKEAYQKAESLGFSEEDPLVKK